MPSGQHRTQPLPSCFRLLSTPALPPPQPPPTSAAGVSSNPNPNLTTTLFHTDLGLFAITWSRTLLGRSLHLHFLPSGDADSSSSSSSFPFTPLSAPFFHLDLKPFFFWKKHGSKKLVFCNKNARIFWDLTRASFGSGPEPLSGFYVAVVVGTDMTLLVGDSTREAYSRTRAKPPETAQSMVLRREHVYGNKMYTTRAAIGGRERDLSIDCRVGDDPRLCFGVDGKRVLQIKHLKWKFRGNEKIDVDGVQVQVSWDVYNWLFEDDEDGYALFMFKFEKPEFEYDDDDDSGRHRRHQNHANQLADKCGKVSWSQQSCGFEFETSKMKKGMLRSRKSSSSSSSSLSSASSTCSSVMEWASNEENELKGPSGFSLLVYAWKS